MAPCDLHMHVVHKIGGDLSLIAREFQETIILLMQCSLNSSKGSVHISKSLE